MNLFESSLGVFEVFEKEEDLREWPFQDSIAMNESP